MTNVFQRLEALAKCGYAYSNVTSDAHPEFNKIIETHYIQHDEDILFYSKNSLTGQDGSIVITKNIISIFINNELQNINLNMTNDIAFEFENKYSISLLDQNDDVITSFYPSLLGLQMFDNDKNILACYYLNDIINCKIQKKYNFNNVQINDTTVLFEHTENIIKNHNFGNDINRIVSQINSEVNSFVDDSENVLMLIPESLQSIFNFTELNSKLSAIIHISDSIQQTIITVKEIDFAIKQMDAHVELMSKEYDMRIEKFKMIAGVIHNQLNNYSDRIDILLDNVLSMNSHSDDINYIQNRSELISLLRGMSDNMSNIFIKLISI